MIAKETSALTSSANSLSPLWLEYCVNDSFLYFNPFSGLLKYDIPSEEHCFGGILADDMGLGKTIEILSLIHSHRFDKENDGGINIPKTKGTLIVCPLNVLSQWKSEIEKCFPADVISCDIYYGYSKVSKDILLQDCADVMYVSFNLCFSLTTYGTLSSEFSGDDSKSPLYAVQWHRVVLDEAHYIKEKSTKMAKACYALSATNRWAVTGTPIVNRLDDLFSLVHFLRIHPWSQSSFWRAFITDPFEKKDPKAIQAVQTVLEPILLRRTKDMKDENGESIVKLPPKTVEIVYLDFSSEESRIYAALNTVSLVELTKVFS
jgi:DNA repair protein RAD5